MHALLLVAQLAAATRHPLPDRDSAALLQRVQAVEFQFMMDWRFIWQQEMSLAAAADQRHPRPTPSLFHSAKWYKAPSGLGCAWDATAGYDMPRDAWAAHLIKAPERLYLSMCPMWSRPNWYEPPDERK